MAFLFDTDAISEVLRKTPAAAYLTWLATVPRDEQYASAVSIAELFKGAYRSDARERHLENILGRVLPAVTVLPFDTAAAPVFGRLSADLERAGQRLADADLMIAATAIHHDLTLVTGNLRHFRRVPGLEIVSVLADARGG